MKPTMYLIVIIWRGWGRNATTITCERDMVNDLVVSILNSEIEDIIITEKQEQEEEKKSND